MPKPISEVTALALTIEARRRALGLSAVELAALLGVKPMALSRWERGEVRSPRGAQVAHEVLCDLEARVSALVAQLAKAGAPLSLLLSVEGLPSSCVGVAVARAAAELRGRGEPVTYL